ncbi:MAG: FUSC family protein [Jatrophihabitantaceae bacterium]
MADPVTTWLRAHDPGWVTTRRALRAAVIVPVTFAVGSQLIGNAQVATFAAFGSFALLLFAGFPGGRLDRLGAYLALAVAGAALITVGTLVASPDWLAVAAMGVIAFAVLFAGVVSSVINASTQAALLAFILAVMLPGVRGDLPERLAGWGIALVISVPVAIVIWPPADQNVLRERAAAMCRALAAMLHLDQPQPGRPDSIVVMSAAARDLRAAFRASAAARTAALGTGARLLIRLVDELEWLTAIVTDACADAPDGWPEQGRRLRDAASRVLSTCAETLAYGGSGPAGEGLGPCVETLRAARTAVAAEALARLRASTERGRVGAPAAGEFGRPLYAAHELGYAVTLAADTVSAMASADSRSWWQRLLGRHRGMDELGIAGAAQRVAARHLDRHSVWLQNSIRAAAGLTLAVLLSRVVGAQNAFWVGLGALSVLRSNALSTGATIVRALAGTVLGFAIGGGAVAVIGTDHAVLWTLLPLVILVAASAPTVTSFVVGQAAFTVFTIILFNIIAPAGWHIGVVRVEDVALGCAASLVAGLLFWPRGAAAALGGAYAEAYRTAASFLRQSIRALDARAPALDAAAGAVATSSGASLDDALRQYLAEQGTKRVPLASVTTLVGGATRLRLAGAAINRLHDSAPGGVVVPRDDAALAAPIGVLDERADRVSAWYSALADTVGGSSSALPTPDDPGHGESFLDVVLPAVDGCGDPDRATRAERLLWTGQYLGDVDRARGALVEAAAAVGAARSQRWWQR